MLYSGYRYSIGLVSIVSLRKQGGNCLVSFFLFTFRSLSRVLWVTFDEHGVWGWRVAMDIEYYA